MTLKTMMMAAVATAALAPAARADLVIQGRAAQALHCSAMLFMVSAKMQDAGLISAQREQNAQLAAVRMLDYVPGTDEQKKQAMKQRFYRLMNSRSEQQLFGEFNETFDWCTAHFL
ncbi:MAG: hypothetical protein QM656_14440 [Paracoccaceae bacterium]